MIIYWILFTCSLLFLLVSFKGSSTLRKYTLLIFYIAIFLISALRVNIGVDYYGHYLIYNYVEMGEWMVTEPLFALVCSICATLHLGFPCVIAVMSFITIFPLYNVARKSDNLYIFLLFFLILYFISYALIRQFAAISLAIYASYFYLVEKKKIKSLIFFLFSFGFHSSLLAYIVIFYLSAYFKIGFLLTFVISLFAFVIGFYTDIFTNLLSSILMEIKYAEYLDLTNQHNVEVEYNSGLGIILRYIIYFTILCVANRVKGMKEFVGRYNLIFILLILTDALSLKIRIFLRLRYVFLPCCFIPFFWAKPIKEGYSHFSLTNGVLLFIVIAYLLMYEATIVSWENIPYESILFNKIR